MALQNSYQPTKTKGEFYACAMEGSVVNPLNEISRHLSIVCISDASLTVKRFAKIYNRGNAYTRFINKLCVSA